MQETIDFSPLKQLISRALNIVPIKYTMTAYLAVLLFLSAWLAGNLSVFAKGMFVVAVYAVADVAWTYWRAGKWYVPLSSFISGFIIALVAAPSLPLWFLAMLPLIAVFSKHVLRHAKRHIFNPAVFALGTASFLFPEALAVSWWGTLLGSYASFLIFGSALVIIYRLGRWIEVVAFLAVFASLFAAEFLFRGGNIVALPNMLFITFFSGSMIFFASVMLIEPITSGFPLKNQRVLFVVVAAIAAFFLKFAFRFFDVSFDQLIFGLLAANAVAAYLFLRPKMQSVPQQQPPLPRSL